MKRIFADMKTSFREERGQTLVLVVLFSVVLMGFLGLAIDVGNARSAERKMQQAADAAAIAAALEIQACGSSASSCSEMSTASQKAVGENGLTVTNTNLHVNSAASTCSLPSMPSTTSTPLLVVDWGPCLLGTSDPNNASSTYVEAAVAENQPAYFGNVFGLHTFAVSARAEAKIGNSPWCIFAQNQLQDGSGGKISANCGAYTDGNLTNAGQGNKQNCNGTQITMTQIDVAGSACPSTKFSPNPVTNAPVLTDPLAYLDNYTPTPGTCTTLPSTYFSGTKSLGTGAIIPLYAGTYCADSNGNALEVNQNDTVNLLPSPVGCSGSGCTDTTFIFKGNVIVDSKATLETPDPISTDAGYVSGATGVTLYFSAGTMQINQTNTTISLYAPPGCYGGALSPSNLTAILLWIDQSETTPILTIPNGYKTTWTGAIYVPSGTIDDVSGSSSTMGAYTIFDAYNVTLDDGATIGSDYSSLCGGSPIKAGVASLVE